MGPTRRELIGATAMGAALAGVGFLDAAPPARAAASRRPAPDPPGPRVARLLSVERLVLYSYDQVLSSPLLDARHRQLLATLRGHEAVHVEALSCQLARFGLSAPAPPSSVSEADRHLARRGVAGRLGQLQGQRDAMRLLLDLERVVTGAYFVALIKLEDPVLIDLAARTMAAEAQHEALLGELLFAGNAQKAVPYGLVQGKQ